MGIRFACSASCPNISSACLTCYNCGKTELKDALQRGIITNEEYSKSLERVSVLETKGLLEESAKLIERLDEIKLQISTLVKQQEN